MLCLADDMTDLRARLGRIIIGRRRDGAAVTAADLKADGAMAALLRDAILPNIVQTLEGNPALIHGGPFGNIAHGCNSVVATRAGLKLADYVVTEAGFGADLGAEKFFDIKCRQAGLRPKAAVIVATIRSLKMNGGLKKSSLAEEDLAALRAGCENLGRHVENVRGFGVPPVVAINHFFQDTEAEVAEVQAFAAKLGVEAVLCRHWADGGAGAEALARQVVRVVEQGEANFTPLYPDDLSLLGKMETVAKRIYRADGVTAGSAVTNQLRRWEAEGFRPPARLHGQDPIQLHHRSHPPGRAARLRSANPSGALERRRWLRGSHLRRHPHHAGPPSPPRRRGHRHRRARAYHRAVLGGYIPHAAVLTSPTPSLPGPTRR